MSGLPPCPASSRVLMSVRGSQNSRPPRPARNYDATAGWTRRTCGQTRPCRIVDHPGIETRRHLQICIRMYSTPHR
eukprot:6520465-Prymnesium_polylepis.1